MKYAYAYDNFKEELLYVYILPAANDVLECIHVMVELIFHVCVFSRIILAILLCYSYISKEREYKNRIPSYSAANLDSVREAIFLFCGIERGDTGLMVNDNK